MDMRKTSTLPYYFESKFISNLYALYLALLQEVTVTRNYCTRGEIENPKIRKPQNLKKNQKTLKFIH